MTKFNIGTKVNAPLRTKHKFPKNVAINAEINKISIVSEFSKMRTSNKLTTRKHTPPKIPNT